MSDIIHTTATHTTTTHMTATHTTSEHLHTEPKRLSRGTYVGAFIVLFLILAVFADLFVFILGTIGLIVTFAAFYKDSDDHGHH